jgi:hypothetical protein
MSHFEENHPSWKQEEINQESITWLLENNTRWLRDDTAKAGQQAIVFYCSADRIARIHNTLYEEMKTLAKGYEAELNQLTLKQLG